MRACLWAAPKAVRVTRRKVPRSQATFATLLLTKGVHPEIMSEMLGHPSIAITLDTYSHVIPGLREAAANAMEEALGDY